LWERELRQDALGLSQAERHRNLEPAIAEFICALAAGIGAKRILEIGGSSGLSTIALAAAARQGSGQVVSIEKDAHRQADALGTLMRLDLARYVNFILGDAGAALGSAGEFDFVFIDCKKDDYIRFFDMLQVASGGVVVADNIISHSIANYVAHLRSQPDVESITLPVGKGFEVTRIRDNTGRQCCFAQIQTIATGIKEDYEPIL
jgi:predicted O-methyltransferase YrrM